MNEINKTLYIPLYGKAQVSKKGIIIDDIKAEEIWEKEGFILHGKAKSKWLTYYMAMRARVFDLWTKEQIQLNPNAIVLHIGCGMDSRHERIGVITNQWFDIDFPQVISERKKYYTENESYHMFEADVSNTDFLYELPEQKDAIVIMEGISMYLTEQSLHKLFLKIQERFSSVHILLDCYTVLGAKASKYKNPIKDVGAKIVSGLDNPRTLEINSNIIYKGELNMTPPELVSQLKGVERSFFKFMFGGKMAKKIYRLFEFEFN
ncbi:MAG: class I SAM-dependent methyltransferase [Clostridium sp.]